MNKKKISGAIGITKLIKKINGFDKKVIIFSDNHNNNMYCEKSFNDSYNIKNLFNKEKFTSQVLLEEVKREKDSDLKELWSSTEHTVELKNLYLNNPNTITPIDIRQYLYIVSWELIDEKTKHHTMKDYLKKIISFFNYDQNIPDLTEKISQIIFKTTGIANYFNMMKSNFNNIIKQFDINETIVNHMNKYNNKFLIMIDDIISKIMDWYTIINIFTTKKKTFIHAGLFHTFNIIQILVNDFNFNIYYQSGTNDFNNKDDIKSCVEI